MRGTRERGAILYVVVFFLLVTLALAALLIDMGGALMTKQQAITASENAATEALTEFYPPDYTNVGLVASPADWEAMVRQLETRVSAQDRAAEHEVGYTIDFRDVNGNPVGPGSSELIVHVQDTNTHIPSIQLNMTNDTSGDVMVGRWEKVPGGQYQFVPVLGKGQGTGAANLPRAMQVVVRRTDDPTVPGVSEGDNPIPFLLRRAMWTGEAGVDPGVYRNRGQRLIVPNTVAMVPAGTIGAGAEVPYQGGMARTGAMPLVLVMRGGGGDTVRNWLTANDPNPTIFLEIDNRGGFGGASEAFFSNYGLGGSTYFSVRNMMRFLKATGAPEVPPPQLDLSLDVNRPQYGFIAMLLQVINLLPFVFNTWHVPVVRQTGGGGKGKGKGKGKGGGTTWTLVGFARIYCDGLFTNGGFSRFWMRCRLAPSAVSRNAIPLRGQIPAAVSAEFLNTFWETVDGERTGSRPFGISSAAATVKYGHVEK